MKIFNFLKKKKQEPKKPKVYCKDCVHAIGGEKGYRCNVIWNTEPNEFTGAEGEKKWRFQLNQRGNCKHFEQKQIEVAVEEKGKIEVVGNVNEPPSTSLRITNPKLNYELNSVLQSKGNAVFISRIYEEDGEERLKHSMFLTAFKDDDLEICLREYKGLVDGHLEKRKAETNKEETENAQQ